MSRSRATSGDRLPFLEDQADGSSPELLGVLPAPLRLLALLRFHLLSPTHVASSGVHGTGSTSVRAHSLKPLAPTHAGEHLVEELRQFGIELLQGSPVHLRT